ncbi:DUF1990 family protein [Arthrobacter roseus]|uniref:DUF1990 family protein n=1 Tax=Arthrobacter roseus TaxID=136274 RepID=UPI001EF8599A|nr:DUF1990 domain-containing protein [Arthrobacter roseus]MBM7847420.1 uncharacterized protein (UPF0548 family) [Arthrobacter roseus]
MSGFTYGERGLTQGSSWPDGYRRLHRRLAVGEGWDAYRKLADGILTWGLQRGAGLKVDAETERAAVGTRVVSRIGVGPLHLDAPCRVVWVEEPDGEGSPQRAGFAYGTLAGHPEQGEEAFIAELTADGLVYVEIRAYSRHANWFYRAGAPVAVLSQWLITRRYLAAARRIVQG